MPVKKIQLFIPKGYSVHAHRRMPHIIPVADLLPHSLIDCPCEPSVSEQDGVTITTHNPFDLRDFVSNIHTLNYQQGLVSRRTYEWLAGELREDEVIDDQGFRDMMFTYDSEFNKKHNVQ